jgi:hypothetical protein
VTPSLPTAKVGRCWRCHRQRVSVHWTNGPRVYLCRQCTGALGITGTTGTTVITSTSPADSPGPIQQ